MHQASTANLPTSEYIHLNQAFVIVKKALISADYAKSVIRRGLGSGDIEAKTGFILREYAHGRSVAFDDRNKELELQVRREEDGGLIPIEKKYLRTRVRGSRLAFNWPNDWIVWYSPSKNAYKLQGKTGRPLARLPIRYVMYNVQVSKDGLDLCIAKGLKDAKQAISAPVLGKQRHTEEDWSKILPEMFELANSRRLYRDNGEIGRGDKADLARRILKDCTQVNTLSTARVVAEYLFKAYQKANSDEKHRLQNIDLKASISGASD